MSLFFELRRRSVFKAGAAYAIVAWLLVQIIVSIEEPLSLPEWSDTLVIVLLAIGFPITLVMSWAYDRTPEGLVRTADVSGDGPVTRAGGDRVNYFLLGLIVPTLAFLVLDQYVLRPAAVTTEAPLPSAGLENAPSASPLAAARTVWRGEMALESREPAGETGLSAHVALSPDGTKLVYAAQAEGRRQLYLRLLDGFETQPIPGTEGAVHPFFSPDGEWIGFYTEEVSTSLKKVSIRGGSALELTDTQFSSGGSWETDDTIVFGTGGAGFGGRNLYRISANGGTPELLLEADGERGYVTPEVLPGGNAALFVIRHGSGGGDSARNGSIGVLSLDTGEVHTLIEGAYRPQYSPTGHVLFGSW